MDVANETRARCAAVPYKDKTGRDVYVVVAKYTFAVDASGRAVIDEAGGAEPRFVDQYNGEDPATSSLRCPSDLFDFKPGTDVILIGHAHPPPHGRAEHVDVSLRVGPIHKTVRAHGLRVWQRGVAATLTPGPAQVIREPIPLLYELAWGGVDLADPERPAGEPRNYVGRGVARDPRTLVNELAPQLEYPEHPVRGRDNEPAGFGAIHRHWQPRAAYAGTYDERWMAVKMPLLPDDFDPRFHVTVPHDQWSPAPLRGDEPIEIRGATPEGVWRLQLPRLAPGFSSAIGGRSADHRTHLDTILIDADSRRVELTFRAAIPLPRKFEMLDGVEVIEKRWIGAGGDAGDEP